MTKNNSKSRANQGVRKTIVVDRLIEKLKSRERDRQQYEEQKEIWDKSPAMGLFLMMNRWASEGKTLMGEEKQ